MKVLKCFLFTAMSAYLAAPLTAQGEPTYNDGQAWFQATVLKSLTLDQKYFVALEVQPRLGEDFSNIERLIIRPAVGYNVSQELSLWGGYGWTPLYLTPNYEQEFRDEHRIWQQVLYTHSVAQTEITLQHRARLEERFIENASGAAVRFRYLLRGSHPFERGGKSGLTAYNEYFLNLNTIDRGAYRGFDRNRIFVGPYLTDGTKRYELGYVGEYGDHFRDGNRVVHAAILSLTFNLD